MGVIEPDGLAGARMCCYSLADGSRPQAVAASPFHFHASHATISFHSSFVAGLKDILPGEVYAFAIITNVKHLLCSELLFDYRIDELKDFAIISNGGSASLLRRFSA